MKAAAEKAHTALIIAALGIPPQRAQMIISGNDQLEPTPVLHNGQEISLFPPLAGGLLSAALDPTPEPLYAASHDQPRH